MVEVNMWPLFSIAYLVVGVFLKKYLDQEK